MNGFDKQDKIEINQNLNPPNNEINDKQNKIEINQTHNPPNNEINDKQDKIEINQNSPDVKTDKEKSLEHFNSQPLQAQLEIAQQQNTKFSSTIEGLLKYLIDNLGNENYLIIKSEQPTKQFNEINNDDIIYIKSTFTEKIFNTKIYRKSEFIQQFTDLLAKLTNKILIEIEFPGKIFNVYPVLIKIYDSYEGKIIPCILYNNVNNVSARQLKCNDKVIYLKIMGNQIKKIQSGSFCGCEKLTYVEITSPITSIESESFKECSSLKEIKILLMVLKNFHAYQFHQQ